MGLPAAWIASASVRNAEQIPTASATSFALVVRLPMRRLPASNRAYLHNIEVRHVDRRTWFRV